MSKQEQQEIFQNIEELVRPSGSRSLDSWLIGLQKDLHDELVRVDLMPSRYASIRKASEISDAKGCKNVVLLVFIGILLFAGVMIQVFIWSPR